MMPSDRPTGTENVTSRSAQCVMTGGRRPSSPPTRASLSAIRPRHRTRNRFDTDSTSTAVRGALTDSGRGLEMVDDVIHLPAVEKVPETRHEETRPGDQPELPGARHRAVEEDRAVTLDEAGGGVERIDEVVSAEQLLGLVEDGGQVEEQHQPQTHDVVDVAIEDVEGPDEEPDADHQQALGKCQDGEEEKRGRERPAGPDEDPEQDRQGEEGGDEVREGIHHQQDGG